MPIKKRVSNYIGLGNPLRNSFFSLATYFSNAFVLQKVLSNDDGFIGRIRTDFNFTDGFKKTIDYITH